MKDEVKAQRAVASPRKLSALILCLVDLSHGMNQMN